MSRGATTNKSILFIDSYVYYNIYKIIPWDLIDVLFGNTESNNFQLCVSYNSGGLTNHITAIMKSSFEVGSQAIAGTLGVSPWVVHSHLADIKALGKVII